MKSIELTEEHKSKLLEMCNKLFPEYIYISWDNQSLDIGSPEGWEKVNQFRISNHIFISKTEAPHDDGIFIHWFEFCMTHLIVKLSKEFTKQKLSKADYTNNQYPNWFSEKVSYHLNPFRNEEFKEDILFIHPVDYLYEEFKKLK